MILLAYYVLEDSGAAEPCPDRVSDKGEMMYRATTVLLLIVALGVLLAIGSGWAQTKDLSPEEKAVFRALDLDGDGNLSRQDFQALDLDGDRRISREEYNVLWRDKVKAQQYFDQFDKNHDGYLTGGEPIGPGILIPIFKW